MSTRPHYAILATTGVVLAALSLSTVSAGAGTVPNQVRNAALSRQAALADRGTRRLATITTPVLAPLPDPLVGERPQVIHSQDPPFTATLRIPELVWPGHEAVALRVDAAIDAWVAGEVHRFRPEVARALKGAHGLPASLPPSSLHLTFRVTELNASTASFLFELQPYFRGEASPAQLPAGLTFDLRDGHEQSLASLWQSGSGYLSVLSRLSLRALKHFAPAKARCYVGPAGPAPTATSFRAWALSPAGLVLSFPAGQYTAAYCGPPTITIPFSALRSMMRQPMPR